MNEYNLKKLQNGSDIRGISLTGVGGSGVPNLRDAEACLLSKGFLLWLCNKTGKAEIPVCQDRCCYMA